MQLKSGSVVEVGLETRGLQVLRKVSSLTPALHPLSPAFPFEAVSLPCREPVHRSDRCWFEGGTRFRFGEFHVPVLACLAGIRQACVVDAGRVEGILRSKKLQYNPNPSGCADCLSPAQLGQGDL